MFYIVLYHLACRPEEAWADLHIRGGDRRHGPAGQYPGRAGVPGQHHFLQQGQSRSFGIGCVNSWRLVIGRCKSSKPCYLPCQLTKAYKLPHILFRQCKWLCTVLFYSLIKLLCSWLKHALWLVYQLLLRCEWTCQWITVIGCINCCSFHCHFLYQIIKHSDLLYQFLKHLTCFRWRTAWCWANTSRTWSRRRRDRSWARGGSGPLSASPPPCCMVSSTPALAAW